MKVAVFRLETGFGLLLALGVLLLLQLLPPLSQWLLLLPLPPACPEDAVGFPESINADASDIPSASEASRPVARPA